MAGAGLEAPVLCDLLRPNCDVRCSTAPRPACVAAIGALAWRVVVFMGGYPWPVETFLDGRTLFPTGSAITRTATAVFPGGTMFVCVLSGLSSLCHCCRRRRTCSRVPLTDVGCTCGRPCRVVSCVSSSVRPCGVAVSMTVCRRPRSAAPRSYRFLRCAALVNRRPLPSDNAWIPQTRRRPTRHPRPAPASGAQPMGDTPRKSATRPSGASTATSSSCSQTRRGGRSILVRTRCGARRDHRRGRIPADPALCNAAEL